MRKLFIILFFIIFSTSLKAEIINNILIKNNDRISDETIITYGQIEIGKNYNNNQINEILKNLYKTNFFENINLKIENETLIIDVQENQIIQTVTIKGVESKSIKESILKNLYSKDIPLIEKLKKTKLEF